MSCGEKPELNYDQTTNLHQFTKCLHVPCLIRILALPWAKSIINFPIFQTRTRKLREVQHHKVISKKGWTKSYFPSRNHDAAHFLIIQWPTASLTRLGKLTWNRSQGLRGRREKRQAVKAQPNKKPPQTAPPQCYHHLCLCFRNSYATY